jgi:hypothetical protein
MHGLSPAIQKEAIMDTARNKDLARRLYALINEGRVDHWPTSSPRTIRNMIRSPGKARAGKASSTGSR